MMQKMLQRSDKKATTEIQSSETEASKEDDLRTHVNIEEEIEIEASLTSLLFRGDTE